VSATMAKKDVAVMQPEAWTTNPSWFLVAGLAWPEDQADAGMAEAAFAVAPDVTQVFRPIGPDGKPVPLGRDLALMLDVGSRCAAALDKRVIFLSDITLWLNDIGLSWERIGVHFPAAQAQLEQQAPGLFITVSSRAHMILCSAGRTLTIYSASDSVADVPLEERESVRASFEARPNADWPSLVTKALASAQPAA
jgi:hypothetical protein